MFICAVFVVLTVLIDLILCQSHCEIGTFYAENYNKCIPCSPSCLNIDSQGDNCDTITGKCKYGCTYGMYGSLCTLHCSFACNNEVCERYTGICRQGCWEGYAGPKCDLLAVLVPDQDTTKTSSSTSSSTSSTSTSSTTSSTTSTTTSSTTSSTTSTTTSSLTSLNKFTKAFRPELTRETVIVGKGFPDDETAIVDVDNSLTPDDDDNHRVYIYIGVAVGVGSVFGIVVSILAFIHKRKNTSSEQNTVAAANVKYTPTYNYIDKTDTMETRTHGNHGNQDPISEHTYDYIDDNIEVRCQTSGGDVYDSDGYLNPTTTFGNHNNGRQNYLTPIHVKPYESVDVNTKDRTKYSALSTNQH